MIHAISITNPKGEALVLDLTNPEKSGLLVANVEGLGPPNAQINGQEMATADGMVYSSARVSSRNIVFTLAMVFRDENSIYGRQSIEESRHLTYKYFPLKKKIKMGFQTDERYLLIDGYVESNAPVIFSSEEYAQISIICPNPYFYQLGEEKTSFSGIQPLFEFPFSNEVSESSPDEKNIVFGEIWLDTRSILNYTGSVDTGMLITIHALGEAKGIRLYNVDTREQMKIDTYQIETITGSPYQAKDDIVISTVIGDRYCMLLRNGIYTNIIGALSRDSDWFQLSSGNNGFAFAADEGEHNLSVTFSFKSAFVGI